MDEKELKKAFILYLAQISGAKSQEELELYIQKLGKDGVEKAYKKFIAELQKLQQSSSTQIAQKGAKLNYISRLNGLTCKDGERLVYFKQGGRVCKKCEKIKEDANMTGGLPYTPIQKSCTGTKLVKEFKNAVATEKCGGKAKKKTKKCQLGAQISDPSTTATNSPQPEMKCGGKAKKKLVKKSCVGSKMFKCGSKVKKKSCCK